MLEHTQPPTEVTTTEATAGSLAVLSVPTIAPEGTVATARETILALAETYTTMEYVYVTDERGVLVGVLSLHELLAAPVTARVAEVMTRDVASVHTQTDQEKVAHLALALSIKAVPVVRDSGTFAGVVPADDILRILRDEHTEDLLRQAGISVRVGGVAAVSRKAVLFARLPWLFLGLLGGLVAAFALHSFEEIIAAHVLLAAFIPVVVYMADAVGAQSQLLTVRTLGTGAAPSLLRSFFREVPIGALLGAVLGAAIALGGWLLMGHAEVMLVVGVSVAATVFLSSLIAVLLPSTLYRLGADPAYASGPLATVMSDIVSLLVYFTIASVLIGS